MWRSGVKWFRFNMMQVMSICGKIDTFHASRVSLGHLPKYGHKSSRIVSVINIICFSTDTYTDIKLTEFDL